MNPKTKCQKQDFEVYKSSREQITVRVGPVDSERMFRESLSKKVCGAMVGLGFLATDEQVYDLLDSHTVGEAKSLQGSLVAIRSNIGFPLQVIIY
jgi:hypothetical protein